MDKRVKVQIRRVSINGKKGNGTGASCRGCAYSPRDDDKMQQSWVTRLLRQHLFDKMFPTAEMLIDCVETTSGESGEVYSNYYRFHQRFKAYLPDANVVCETQHKATLSGGHHDLSERTFHIDSSVYIELTTSKPVQSQTISLVKLDQACFAKEL